MAEVIRATGKTQADLDAESAREDRKQEKAEALKFLRDSDYRIVRKAEEFLAAQGAIDFELLEARRLARGRVSADSEKIIR